jgi:hypothetical protein
MILERSNRHPAKDTFKKAKPRSANYDLESLESLWTQISLEPEIVNPDICEYPDAGNKPPKILPSARTIDRVPSISR